MVSFRLKISVNLSFQHSIVSELNDSVGLMPASDVAKSSDVENKGIEAAYRPLASLPDRYSMERDDEFKPDSGLANRQFAERSDSEANEALFCSHCSH